MKNLKFPLLAGLAGMAISSAAQAEGGYFSFGGGFSLPSDSNADIRRPPTGAADNAVTTFDTGYILSGALGYKWATSPRTERE